MSEDEKIYFNNLIISISNELTKKAEIIRNLITYLPNNLDHLTLNDALHLIDAMPDVNLCRSNNTKLKNFKIKLRNVLNHKRDFTLQACADLK